MLHPEPFARLRHRFLAVRRIGGMGGASIAERNLDRLTVGIGAIWFACVIALGLLLAYQS